MADSHSPDECATGGPADAGHLLADSGGTDQSGNCQPYPAWSRKVPIEATRRSSAAAGRELVERLDSIIRVGPIYPRNPGLKNSGLIRFAARQTAKFMTATEAGAVAERPRIRPAILRFAPNDKQRAFWAAPASRVFAPMGRDIASRGDAETATVAL